MTPGSKIILEPTTNAAASESFGAMNGQYITVISNGYIAAEKAVVEIYDDAQNDWYPYVTNGIGYSLSITTNMLDIWLSAGIYRLNKEATTDPVGITLRNVF